MFLGKSGLSFEDEQAARYNSAHLLFAGWEQFWASRCSCWFWWHLFLLESSSRRNSLPHQPFDERSSSVFWQRQWTSLSYLLWGQLSCTGSGSGFAGCRQLLRYRRWRCCAYLIGRLLLGRAVCYEMFLCSYGRSIFRDFWDRLHLVGRLTLRGISAWTWMGREFRRLNFGILFLQLNCHGQFARTLSGKGLSFSSFQRWGAA